jgi:hypothetical protein
LRSAAVSVTGTAAGSGIRRLRAEHVGVIPSPGTG